ncbi:hypothetical protein [Shewanella pealeana]|uniref:Uncharacterized protein n=1 Tax=Shewanella pealeana (strain ATCC 700345 / ANG-SQ1) TaxID=398579 RepID=A8H227_SHEPA|nr:hypothetical protein [Shewanella pealeana]ABV86614.1 conserved hypothetical protein [Shewanella pealeana ATCC 700345]
MLAEYKQNPQAVAQASGLSDDEIQAVISGDVSPLKSVSGGNSIRGFMVVYANMK